MDSYPCLEIDPVRTLMVLGPQVTAQCLGDCSTHHLSYRLLVESGIKAALEIDSFHSKEDRTRKETLLKHAYELEPAFASSKVAEVLRSHGRYEDWLKQNFSSANVKLTEKGNAVLQHLLALRQEGVRLAYTHYDETLSRALGLPPVILEDAEGVKKWSQGFPALLHLHGVAVRPQSVIFDCLSYENTVGGAPSADLVLEQFSTKTVIFVGFDDIYFDPFLHKLVKTFANFQEAKLACPPLFLSASMTTRPDGVLPLPVGPISDLHHYIRSSSTNFKTASSQAPILFQFVFTSQAASQGFLDKLQKTIDSSSLSPLAGTVGSHFVVLLQVQGPASILRVWESMFKDTVKMSDLSCLLAAALQDRFTVWLKQNDSEPSPNHIQNGVGLPPVLLPSSSSSTNGFIPVPIPVTSWKPFSAISFSPQFALACNTQKHLELAQQQLQAIQHEKIRRIQSENDKLSFQDHINNVRKPPSRNGFLVHQQSAPVIPISPAVMLNTADIQTSLSSPIAVPSPSILMNLDQKLKEHRIERIEQQPHVTKKNQKEEPLSTQTGEKGDDKGTGEGQKDAPSLPFEDQRQKFIEEARKFSATVGTWIQQQEQGVHSAAAVLPTSSDSFQEVGRHFEQLQRVTLGAATTGMPLVPLGMPGSLMSLPLHSPSTTSSSILSPSTPSVGSHSPKILPGSQQLQQQSPALVPLISNPHSAGSMVTLLQPSLPLSSLASTVFPSQLPVFMTPPASSKSSTSSDPPSVPAALPVSTAVNEHQPFGSSEQKVMVLMPNGSMVSMAMPSGMARVPGSPVVVKQEEDKGEVFVRHASKRTGSPNSDTVYHSKPPLKRRRSSSLPDVSLGSTAKTPSTLSPTSPVPSSPSHAITNGILPGEGGPTMVQFPPSLLLSRTPPGVMQDQEKNESPSLESGSLHPVPPGRGPIQLWQFLLDLLMTQDKVHMIQWTGNGYEFRINQPEEIAKLWGARKNKPRMNYDKLSRGLRYYYSKGIMDKVPGKKLTFKYTCDIQKYMMQKSGNPTSHPAHTKTLPTITV